MMLASNFRIKEKGKIEEVKQKGKLLQSDNFGVSVLKKEASDYPKFAFIISTKISKLAVHRNRVNRSFQEGIRRSLPLIPKNYYYIFLAKKTINDMSTDEIIKETMEFIKNIKLS